MESKLIAIVGMPGSGKSVAAEFFKKKEIPVLRLGDQTDIGLKEMGMEINPKNESWYREKIREDFGMAAMAIKIEPRIQSLLNQSQIIALDGLYSWEEYLYLRKKFSQLKLLCIYARPEIRYARLQKRKVRPLTKQEAQDRDIHEIEQTNKGGPIAIADYLIKNESSESEFMQELETFFTSI